MQQEIGPDASPTRSMSNCDLRNLKVLHKLDIPGVHLLNTAIVDLQGKRLLAQTILPGILNSEQNSCTEYGSMDEGKTIYNNPEVST
jgi:protein TIF31